MKGVYPRENSIQIYFQLGDVKYRETVTGSDGKPLPPTPKNLAYAAKLREQILRAISAETFDLAEYFPHSKTSRRTTKVVKPTNVEEAVEAFLTSKTKKLAPTSLTNYRSALRHLTNDYGKARIESLDFLTLDGYLSKLEVSNATHNALLGVFHAFFNYCVKAKLIEANPAGDVEKLRKKDPEPDPLLPGEVQAVLADMRKHYDPQVANYFELAFLIGCRPSEMIDLRWGNLDENAGTILVNSAKVWGIVKDTKTHKSRTVELDAACLAVLRRQKEDTFLKKHERIFDNPATGRPWYRSTDLHLKYWIDSLRRCGVRTRDSRQTRHTCATMMLMAGCRDTWAALQLGHSVDMFRKTYSKWIPQIDAGTERGKMATLIANQKTGAFSTENSLGSISA